MPADTQSMQPAEIERFEFVDRTLDPRTGTVNLRWRLSGAGQRIELCERFEFGPPAPSVVDENANRSAAGARAAALEAGLDWLHWIAGVSYWKAACHGEVGFLARCPDPDQARVLEAIYRNGLAELAWRNGLRRRYWPAFSAAAGKRSGVPAGRVGLARRALVPMGGGKDSLVALERVRAAGMPVETVQIGDSTLIERVAAAAGTRHWKVARRLAPGLAGLNRAGALNGHVPITAINAAALVFAALWWDFDAVVFANERSADTPTLTAPDGSPVNHQFAKSYAFERMFGTCVNDSVAADLDVFSILRRERELAICREFAGLARYHDVFSSCNRNFHLDGPRTRRWCGACPKCRFVYLALAPFLEPARLVAIFGSDLLADAGGIEGFAELLELGGPRPFECVGEADEARCAVRMLASQPAWRNHAVVATLGRRLQHVDVPDPGTLMRPGGPDRIPERFGT